MNCPTCGKSVYSPYRRQDKQGNIIEGCIDKFHDPVLVKPSTSWQWVTNNRKKNKTYCKEECYIRSKPKKEQSFYCKNCNLV